HRRGLRLLGVDRRRALARRAGLTPRAVTHRPAPQEGRSRAPDTPNVVDVTEDDCASAGIEASGSEPVLGDFWATWGRPCTRTAPVLDELAASESHKLTVAKLDVEANQELAAEYQITAIPALLLFSEGKPV